MKSSSMIALCIYVFWFITGVVAPSPSSSDFGTFASTEALVMNGEDVWPEKKAKRFHNNRCEVRLQGDGNFVVKRILAPNPWYQTLHTAWTTGSAGIARAGTYRAQLEEDGSLVVIHTAENGDETQVYTSNVGEPQALEDSLLEQRIHKLVITEECVLNIYRDDVEVWTNNRFGGLAGEAGISNFLQKGEIFYLKQCYQCGDHPDCVWSEQALILQHDCNLVHFAGRDLADLTEESTILWSSNTRRTDLQDCYLYQDSDKVRLYEGKLDKSLAQFAPREGESYWEADDDFIPICSGGYEVLLKIDGGLVPSC